MTVQQIDKLMFGGVAAILCVAALLVLTACSTATHTPERAGHSGPETRGVVSMVDAPGTSSGGGKNP